MPKDKAQPARVLVAWIGPANSYIHGFPVRFFTQEPFEISKAGADRLVAMTTSRSGKPNKKGHFKVITAKEKGEILGRLKDEAVARKAAHDRHEARDKAAANKGAK